MDVRRRARRGLILPAETGERDLIADDVQVLVDGILVAALCASKTAGLGVCVVHDLVGSGFDFVGGGEDWRGAGEGVGPLEGVKGEAEADLGSEDRGSESCGEDEGEEACGVEELHDG